MPATKITKEEVLRRLKQSLERKKNWECKVEKRWTSKGIKVVSV